MTYYLKIDILSNDSDCEGVRVINLSLQTPKKDVLTFLNELRGILRKADFNIDEDIVLIIKSKSGEDRKYSTQYTLLDLDYDVSDVVDRLCELTVEEYSESLVDKDDQNPLMLFVFGKNINNKLVYVKLKIKGTGQKFVLCVSFHYAKAPMRFPYA